MKPENQRVCEYNGPFERMWLLTEKRRDYINFIPIFMINDRDASIWVKRSCLLSHWLHHFTFRASHKLGAEAPLFDKVVLVYTSFDEIQMNTHPAEFASDHS